MKERIKTYVTELPLLKRIVEISKGITLPGFAGTSVYTILHFFFKELRDDQITMRAAAVSFYFILALFPSIIFLFTLIPLIPVEGFRVTLYDSMLEILPDTAFYYLQEAIEDILTVQRVDLLSTGFVMAFYFSTSGVNALMRSFNKAYPIFKKRSFVKSQLVAIQLNMLLILLLVVSIALIIVGDHLIDQIAEAVYLRDAWSLFILNLIRWTIIIVFFFIAISTIYYFGPATTTRWHFLSAGSFLATVLLIITSLSFSFVVNNYDLYNKIYGSIGALVAIILWIYLNTLILLIGFEINASINFHKNLKAGA